MRAIFRSQPFTMLQPETYDQWRDIDITFDPRDLLHSVADQKIVSSSVSAEIYTYSCKAGGKSFPLKVDASRNVLTWKGKAYSIELQQDCGKLGWHAVNGSDAFDFCTATKGYADFQQNGTTVQCLMSR